MTKGILLLGTGCGNSRYKRGCGSVARRPGDRAGALEPPMHIYVVVCGPHSPLSALAEQVMFNFSLPHSFEHLSVYSHFNFLILFFSCLYLVLLLPIYNVHISSPPRPSPTS